MNVLGIGSDIVECPRIGKMIETHGEAFLRRVYTEREIRHCHTRKHAIEAFAGYWAAKEAILRALGARRRDGVSWTQVEIRQTSGGRPEVRFGGEARQIIRERGVRDVHVAISHCRTYATAYAMALGAASPATAQRGEDAADD